MEIEKKRETSWKIQIKKKNEYVELTSVEISGEVRLVKLGLLNNDKSINVEMNKEEFFNFLSLLSAFREVVIGEDSILNEESIEFIESHPQSVQEYSEIDYQISPERPEDQLENNDTEELNPEEWDPW